MLANLIVITENEHDLDELANMVGDVTVEHPARIFLVAANRRKGTPKLDAYISARCSLPVPGGKQVCCEQISLLADGPEANKIPSIVTSLLVSDVPSVLLWKARVDVRDTMLHSLAKVVNRVLIDSSEDSAPEPALLAWRSLMRAHGTHTTFGDLAWTHLVAWRSILANAFNPPDMRPQLGAYAITTVTVTLLLDDNPRNIRASAESLLLAAWLTYPNCIGRFSSRSRKTERANTQRNFAAMNRRSTFGSRKRRRGIISQAALNLLALKRTLRWS